MKKVFFISAANSIHTVKWVNALSGFFEVHLIYCANHEPGIHKISEKVKLHKLKFNAPMGYYLNVFELKKLYKQIKPDIVNTHYASGYGTLMRASRLKNTLLSIWGSDVYDFPNESKMKKYILYKNVKHAKYIASTSNVMANELKKQFPKLDKEIFITPFGVDIDKFKKSESNKNTSELKVGLIKKLEKKYGIENLILAVKCLKQKLIDNNEMELQNRIKCYIYGEGSEKENLQQLINKENLQDSVYLMGSIPNDEVPQILNSLSVFCATSILDSESFGVAVVEAMACEVPVVVTNVDGFCEVVVDKETGYIVEKCNIEQMAEGIEKILKNKEEAVRLGCNGRRRVEKYYDWKLNVQTMKEIYEKML